jgi:hypothetical protein
MDVPALSSDSEFGLDPFQNRCTLGGSGWSRPIRPASSVAKRIRFQPLSYKPVLQITSEAKARAYHAVWPQA